MPTSRGDYKDEVVLRMRMLCPPHALKPNHQTNRAAARDADPSTRKALSRLARTRTCTHTHAYIGTHTRMHAQAHAHTRMHAQAHTLPFPSGVFHYFLVILLPTGSQTLVQHLET